MNTLTNPSQILKAVPNASNTNNVINIKYNSYTYDVEIKNSLYHNNANQCKEIVENNKGRIRIEEWFPEFLEKLREDLNDNFSINFKAYDFVCKKIAEQVADFNVKNAKKKSVTYKFNPTYLKHSDVLGVISSAFETLKNNSNGKVQGLESLFKQIADNEVSIAVMATMSAGKSTLLNSFIGEDLMPSKSGACTATICELKHSDNKKFFGEVSDDFMVIIPNREIDKEFISERNDQATSDDKFLKISINGPIKNISSKGMNLVLIDTPGPNNSRADKHKETAYNLLRDQEKNPLILYLINAQAIGTNDDKYVLNEIRETLNKYGNAPDRILFVLNKFDEIDLDKKESLESTIKYCEDYLRDNEIENVKIFPLSSKFSYLTLSQEAGLSRNQKDDLYNLERKILPDSKDDYLGMDTIKYAPIPEKIKKKFYDEAKSDTYKRNLHYSGFSALKYYLEDYINNTHKTVLIHNVLEKLIPVYSDIVNKGRLSLSDKDAIFKVQLKELNELCFFLDKNFDKKKEELEQKITDIPINNILQQQLSKKIAGEFRKILEILKSEKVEKGIAQNLLVDAENILKNLKSSLKTTIEKDCSYNLTKIAAELDHVIYKSFANIVKEAKLSELNTEILLNDIKLDLLGINTSSYAEKYSYLKEEKVGDKKIDTSVWWNIFSWGSYKLVPVYGNKSYVDCMKIYNQQISPLQNKTQSIVDDVFNHYNNQVSKIKESANDKVAEIEEKLKGKRAEYESILSKNIKTQEEKNKIRAELNHLNCVLTELQQIGN